MGEEAIEGVEADGDGLGFSVPVKAILQTLSFDLFFLQSRYLSGNFSRNVILANTDPAS